MNSNGWLGRTMLSTVMNSGYYDPVIRLADADRRRGKFDVTLQDAAFASRKMDMMRWRGYSSMMMLICSAYYHSHCYATPIVMQYALF